MAIATIYKDLDISFTTNVYKDLAITTNSEAIKKALINRLIISPAEIPFLNSDYPIIPDLIHNSDDISFDAHCRDILNYAIARDTRIKKLNFFTFKRDPNSYDIEIQISIEVNFNLGNNTNVIDLSFIVNKI